MYKIKNRQSPSLRGIILVYALSVILLCGFSAQLSAASTSISTSTPIVEEIIEEVDKQNSSSGIAHPQMPFKLGFEFQEINGLCGWALDDGLVQKKPVFHVADGDTDKTLWELVIDTDDIEFVTEPFAFDERELLQKCTRSIHLFFSVLIDMLNKEDQGITFGQWTSEIQNVLGQSGCSLKHDALMDTVAERLLKKPSAGWRPGFNPQATIQHPLEFTIPLYFNLFGFDNAAYTIPFSSSLPGADFVVKAMRDGDSDQFQKVIKGYTANKLVGLFFLQALTLVTMTPDGDDDDPKLLQETLNSLKSSRQVDAKMKLPLMSRRPFSRMWEEIKRISTVDHYAPMFDGMLKLNKFFIANNVAGLFGRANYAEQVFNRETGKILPLLDFKRFFKEDFFEKNEEVITHLLEQGVLSTTMIRNFLDNNLPEMLGADSLKDYYKRSLESVETPEESRYVFDGNNIKREEWGHDILSPPLMLDCTNSMGRFKHQLSIAEQRYGEAIVEVRAIKDVATRFLSKSSLGDNREGKFLKDPIHIEYESVYLFDFLYSFSDENLEDFSVGLPYTLMKNARIY